MRLDPPVFIQSDVERRFTQNVNKTSITEDQSGGFAPRSCEATGKEGGDMGRLRRVVVGGLVVAPLLVSVGTAGAAGTAKHFGHVTCHGGTIKAGRTGR
jgi:hypothetical protein